MKEFFKHYYDKKLARLYFDYDFLINCYDLEIVDPFQKIVKDFYDTTACIIHNMKI